MVRNPVELTSPVVDVLTALASRAMRASALLVLAPAILSCSTGQQQIQELGFVETFHLRDHENNVCIEFDTGPGRRGMCMHEADSLVVVEFPSGDGEGYVYLGGVHMLEASAIEVQLNFHPDERQVVDTMNPMQWGSGYASFSFSTEEPIEEVRAIDASGEVLGTAVP